VYLKSSKTIKAPGKAEKKNKAIREDNLIENGNSKRINFLYCKLSGIKAEDLEEDRMFSRTNEIEESKKEIPGDLVDM